MQTLADRQQLPWPCRLPSEPMQYTRPSPLPSEHAFPSEHVGSAFDILTRQISGSLQRMSLTEPPRVLPSIDPYRASPAIRKLREIRIGSFAFGGQPSHRPEELAGVFESYLNAVVTALPKTVASFVGRVESLSGDSANVLLINEQTGERLESQCDADVLREIAIGAGDEFRCEVVRSKGTTSTRFSRLAPKKLSKERVEQIQASFKDRWKF